MRNFSGWIRSASLVVPVAVALSVLEVAPAAQAQSIQTVYSDVTTAVSYFTQAGATTASGATLMVADDITLAPGATGAITGFSFSMINANSVTASAEPIISFYDATGTSGGPGSLLAAYNFGPISLPSLNYTIITINNPSLSTLFTSPPGKFWVGETFDNAGGSTATVTQLNSFGEVIFNPITVGSSTNNFFISTNAGSAAYLANNPAGASTYHFTGTNPPAANFGFAFTGASTALEPSALALSLSGGFLTIGGLLRRRRRCAS